MGEGAFGTVFSHPSWPFVLKLFPRDDCYLKFVRFGYSNPRPCFPKFYGLPRKILPTFSRQLDMAEPYVLRIEKLVFPNDAWKISLDVNHMLDELKTKDPEFRNAYYLKTHDGMFGNVDPDSRLYGVVKGALMAKEALGACALDIHSENIMMRESTGELVLSDPVYAQNQRENLSVKSVPLDVLRYLDQKVKPGKRHSFKPNRYAKRRRNEKLLKKPLVPPGNSE